MSETRAVDQAGVVCISDGHLLASVRGSIGLPKGRVEIGEAPLVAAIRATREETGIGVTCTGLLGRIGYKWGGVRIRLHVYSASPTELGLLPDASGDATWIPVRRAIQSFTFDANRAAVRADILRRRVGTRLAPGSPLSMAWTQLRAEDERWVASRSFPGRLARRFDGSQLAAAFGTNGQAESAETSIRVLHGALGGRTLNVVARRGAVVITSFGMNGSHVADLGRSEWEEAGELLGSSMSVLGAMMPRRNAPSSASPRSLRLLLATGVLTAREVEHALQQIPDSVPGRCIPRLGSPLDQPFAWASDGPILAALPVGGWDRLGFGIASLAILVPPPYEKHFLRGVARYQSLDGLPDDFSRWTVATAAAKAAAELRSPTADLAELRTDLLEALRGHELAAQVGSARRTVARDVGISWPGKQAYRTGESSDLPWETTAHIASRERSEASGQLWCADNREAIDELLVRNQRFGLVYVDPPFATGEVFRVRRSNSSDDTEAFNDRWPRGLGSYLSHISERLSGLSKLVTASGWIVLHTVPDVSGTLRLVADEILGAEHYRGEIVWHYRWTRRHRQWARHHDQLLCYGFGEEPFGLPQRSGDVWDVPVAREEERTGLQTQKPVDLMMRLIQTFGDPAHAILDPYLGSATTAVAAHRLDRRWVGIENGPVSQLAARKRLSGHQVPTTVIIKANDSTVRGDLAVAATRSRGRTRFHLCETPEMIDYWAVGPMSTSGCLSERWASFSGRSTGIVDDSPWLPIPEPTGWGAIAIDALGNLNMATTISAMP